MQPGDIVESVDMEMSDDETDSKPKGRVLVDLRSQDRDMRIGAPPSSSSHLDMDMRMISLPSGQIPGPRSGQVVQDVHLMRPGLPPPPPPQFQHQGQGGFRQEQSEFSHHNQTVDFHSNQSNFRQNRPPPNFLSNQQDFHQQEFHQLQQPQQDFHQSQQDFDYHDREHNMRPKQDFLTESPGRGRYSQSTDHSHQRDNVSFHRNDRNNRGNNRGFPRNRRDRYSDDHNIKQRNVANSRKPRSQDQQHHQSPSEILPNSRPLLLQPPETVIILDEEGMPISMPEFDQDNNVSITDGNSNNCQSSSMPRSRRMSHDMSSSHEPERNQQSQQQKQHGTDHDQRAPSSIELDDQTSSTPMNQVTVIPITADNISEDPQQQNQYVPISEYEEHVESTEHSTVGSTEKPNVIDESADGQQQGNFTENEQLDDVVSPTASGSEMKRPNGNFDEQSHEEESPIKKRTLLPNGPQMPGVDPIQGSNDSSSYVGTSTMEIHPTTPPVYEYDGPNFRPRIGAPFLPWRCGPPLRGGRGGFRGGPRAPWMDRGPPRGPAAGNFSSRGLKRGGGQFRGGGGFRGRGRGSNW